MEFMDKQNIALLFKNTYFLAVADNGQLKKLIIILLFFFFFILPIKN